MGYDVHITRKDEWFDEGGSQIDLKEWLAYIDSDAEMRLDGYAEAKAGSGDILRIESEGLSVWLSYSGHEKNGNMAWFDFRTGNVVVKNPDQEILKKMWSIADSLSAKVQGDEGELYGADGCSIDIAPIRTDVIYLKKPWWKLW